MADSKVERYKRWITSQAYIQIMESKEEKKRRMQEKVESKDTTQRIEIQMNIKKMCNEGKTKEEILKKLMFLTAVKGYNPNFIKYYETWIDNMLIKNVQNKVEECER